MNANRFLTDAEKEKVENAIAEAEKATSAELVCAVATESGRYDRAESIVGLLFSLLALGVAEILHAQVFVSEGSWSSQGGIAIGWQVLAVVIGFIVGSGLATYWFPLRKIFVGQKEIEEELDGFRQRVC